MSLEATLVFDLASVRVTFGLLLLRRKTRTSRRGRGAGGPSGNCPPIEYKRTTLFLAFSLILGWKMRWTALLWRETPRVRISAHFVWRHWRDLRYMFVDVRKQRKKLFVRDNFKTMRKITIFLCFLILVCALSSTLVYGKNPCFSPSRNSHKYKCELKNAIFKPNDYKDHLSTTITDLWVQLRKNWTKEWDK